MLRVVAMERQKGGRRDMTPYEDIQQTQVNSQKSRRVTPYQDAHRLEYRLDITERNSTNSTRVSYLSFHLVVRRRSVLSERQRTTQKYFKNPFRPDHYRQHHEVQHPTRWSTYQELTDEKKTWVL